MGVAPDMKVRKALQIFYLRIRATLLTFPEIFRKRKITSIPDNFNNILFIRPDRIGDMVLSTPAFAALKAKWPQAHLTVLASPDNAAVLKNNPHVDEVVIYSQEATFSERQDVLRGLRGRFFDLAVDPSDDYELRTAWLARRSGAATRIGYSGGGREVFFNGPVLDPRPGRHFVDTALDLLAQIGCPAADRQPRIFLSADERDRAEVWLKERGLGADPILGVHPGAHYETQRWPLEYYTALARLIREKGDMDVIVFGMPKEINDLKFIGEGNEDRVHLFAVSDLRNFLALLARCRLLVCNNSGPLHCATALGIPTVSFMGPTDRDRWYPIGDDHIVLRRDDLPCIGCGRGSCPIKTHECMRSIKPAKVFKITNSFFNR